MAITLKTECINCLHHHICRNRDNAEFSMNKLKNTQFGDGPNDDFDWDIMMKHYNVNIEFSCPDFVSEELKRGGVE